MFETLTIRLSTKLDLVCSPKATGEAVDDVEARAAYAHSLLSILSSVIELKVNAKHPDIPKYIDRLVPGLFNLFVFLALSDSGSETLASQTRLHQAAGQIIMLIVRTLAPEYKVFNPIDTKILTWASGGKGDWRLTYIVSISRGPSAL